MGLQEIQARVKANQKTFLAYEKKIAKTRSLKKRCALANEAATMTLYGVTDIFASPTLEAPFLELAQKHSVQLSETYRPKTMLHVLTMAAKMGGHTRCAARWMTQNPEYKHSCVLVGQEWPIPEDFIDTVQASGGECVIYDLQASQLERALQLRRMAAQFETVVLHTHMHDPIALIAFGTPEFKRPVVFFNHADHAFWLGVSIADVVADINTLRQKGITLAYRGVKNSYLLGIPQEDTKTLSVSRQEARERLGIPFQQKVIFASGNTVKFSPIGEVTFETILTELFKQDPSIVVYLAGPDASKDFWPRLIEAYPKNVILTGVIDYATEYSLYVAMADLIIDSYPLNGNTTVIDAIKAGKPVLALNTSFQLDFLYNTALICHTVPELVEKACRCLNDPRAADALYQEINARFVDATDPKFWHQRRQALLASLPKQHQIRTFERPDPPATVTQFSVEAFNFTYSRPKRLKKSFKELRRSIFWMRLKKGDKILRIFGFDLIKPKKRK